MNEGCARVDEMMKGIKFVGYILAKASRVVKLEEEVDGQGRNGYFSVRRMGWLKNFKVAEGGGGGVI